MSYYPSTRPKLAKTEKQKAELYRKHNVTDATANEKKRFFKITRTEECINKRKRCGKNSFEKLHLVQFRFRWEKGEIGLSSTGRVGKGIEEGQTN